MEINTIWNTTLQYLNLENNIEEDTTKRHFATQNIHLKA